MKRREHTDMIVVHCAYTKPSMDIGAEWIRRVHVDENGWGDIGYHFVIRRDGVVEAGRDIWRVGAHEEQVNHRSVAICLAGGMAEQGGYEDNFTGPQWASLAMTVNFLLRMYRGSRVAGHREFEPDRACPCTDIKGWWYGGGGSMSVSSVLKDVIGSVAPTVATALGGPFAGVAMKFLADKLGVDDTGKVEEFLAAATQDPESLMQLKNLEYEFKQFMRDADIKEAELAVRDRESARDLAVSRGIVVQAALSGAYTVGYFTTLSMFILGYATVDEAYVGMVQSLLGALGAAQLQILNFWFGSSRGSKEKTEALKRIIVPAGSTGNQ